VVRSLTALSAGLVRGIGEIALPASVRRTNLYRTMVEVALRFMIEEVGQVEGIYPGEGQLAQNFLLKRTASHGIELLGILTFHASPVWILAALADATGGSRALIEEISQALKDEGLLEPNTRFETTDQMLDGLERASAHLADSLNLPPIDTAGLRKDWVRLQQELGAIPPKRLPAVDKIEALWREIKSSARVQDRSVFMVSSLMAVSAAGHLPANILWLSRAARSAARRTGKVLGEAVLDHYSDTLKEISRTGFAGYWTREFRPYLRAAAGHFSPGKDSSTERLIRKL
jgi:hypothetical protein